MLNVMYDHRDSSPIFTGRSNWDASLEIPRSEERVCICHLDWIAGCISFHFYERPPIEDHINTPVTKAGAGVMGEVTQI